MQMDRKWRCSNGDHQVPFFNLSAGPYLGEFVFLFLFSSISRCEIKRACWESPENHREDFIERQFLLVLFHLDKRLLGRDVLRAGRVSFKVKDFLKFFDRTAPLCSDYEIED